MAAADSYSTRKPERVPFRALANHLEKQVRGGTVRATVNRYGMAMKNGVVFPPLQVADVGGALVLVDGFHRRAAYEQLGFDEAEAEIVPCASLAEAEWLAFQANMHHGQPLKTKAFRPAFRAYVRANKHVAENGRLQSYREISSALVVPSYSAIRRWMQADFPKLFAAMGGGTDAAMGGLHDGGTLFDPTYEVTLKALTLLDSVAALAEGVPTPDFRRRIAARASEVTALLTLSDGGENWAGDEDWGF